MPLAGLFQKHYKHAVQCSAESLGEWSVTWGFSEGGLTRLTTRYCLSVCSLLKGAFCVNTAVSGSCLQPALWQTNQFDLPLDQGQGCNSAIDYFLWFLVAGQGLGGVVVPVILKLPLCETMSLLLTGESFSDV